MQLYLGDMTQREMILSVLHGPRWPRQVRRVISRHNIAVIFVNANVHTPLGGSSPTRNKMAHFVSYVVIFVVKITGQLSYRIWSAI
jgi:hypothetical protein